MSIYDLSFNNSRGTKVGMSQYRGKVLLLVNTATKCGLAPQFEGLEELHQKYKDKGLVVIGFPSNQFAHQEPESDETMASVCKINFGVTFLLSEKILVNGANTHPIFKHLKEKSNKGFLGKRIKWNFTKFLVSADGTEIHRYSPTVKPLEIERDIEAFLMENE